VIFLNVFLKKLFLRGRTAAKTTAKCLTGVMSAHVNVQALLNAVKKKKYQTLVPLAAVSTAQTEAVNHFSLSLFYLPLQ